MQLIYRNARLLSWTDYFVIDIAKLRPAHEPKLILIFIRSGAPVSLPRQYGGFHAFTLDRNCDYLCRRRNLFLGH